MSLNCKENKSGSNIYSLIRKKSFKTKIDFKECLLKTVKWYKTIS